MILRILFLFLLILHCLSGPWRISMAHANEPTHRDEKPNRLIHEKSPYLLQHAYNPVDWYPWGEEAFEKARKEDKPIFLSIGYSTCHWCHVMERESFEDVEVAKLMNDVFVSIKVDREERPDLDHLYMTVSQMLTGGGGWPLNIFMTPEKKPFFAATYIPKSGRFGKAGMMELIPRIQSVWQKRRAEVFESAEKIIAALKSMETDRPGEELDLSTLEKAYKEFSGRYDATYGGFSTSPKFPTPHNFLFMLRYWKRKGKSHALEMVEKTLQEMRFGGIYDQIGFGFHRYSTDREWLVPHFEKMLYDQAMLALAYIEAFQVTGNEIYGNTAREIFTYVLRDMTGSEGGFYSAEDADSEGEEGKFYVWEEKEIQEILGKDASALFIRVFNVASGGNFKEEATGHETGTNILYMGKSLSEIASEVEISPSVLETQIIEARKKLFEVREKRIHPYKDDKVLTDWNGLMIAAFARGARVLGEPEYAEAAKRAVEFIMKHLRKEDGRLLHRFREGEAKIEGLVDDYAFLIWGLIELYQATFEAHYLRTALDLNDELLKHFWDKDRGGFFFTPDDGEVLIVRKKEVYDGAVPSGNAVAAYNLLRLARFTADPELEKKASETILAFSGQIHQFPSGYTQFLVAADFALGPAYEVVVVGKPGAKDTSEMLKALTGDYFPNKVTLFRPSGEKSPGILDVAGFVREHASINGKATAYVCVATACLKPTTDIKEMLSMIK